MTVGVPPADGVIVIDPVCVVKILLALANTLMVTGLLALTLVLLTATDSQEVLLAGVVVTLKETAVALAVDNCTELEVDWPVTVFNVTEGGLATIVPLLP